MVKIDDLRTDPALENDGVWVQWVRGAWFKVARMDGSRFAQEVRRRAAERRQEEPDVDIDGDDAKQLVASAVLLDWRGLQDSDGNELPYSQEKALELMRDRRLRDMFAFVVDAARSAELFRHKATKADAGN